MKHILFGPPGGTLSVALLIKESGLTKTKIERHYVKPSEIPNEEFIAFDLAYDNPKKVLAKTGKAHLAELLPELKELDIKTVLVCDGNYFKFLTKESKADPFYGYVCPCVIEGYEDISVVLSANHQALMFNPTLQDKMDRALTALDAHVQGAYEDPGKDIIETAYYPESVDDIAKTLEALHQFPELACDIEAKSLEFWNAGISTISFAWDKHNGVAFGIERAEEPAGPFQGAVWRDLRDVQYIKALLMTFMLQYEGKVIWHNIAYDAKVLVYELWMSKLNDYPGMIEGIQQMTRNFDDTQLIAYLATNNAVQNELGLKGLSAEFTGNYAEDVTDTTKVPLANLLEYNLKDCLATWYVKEKYEPRMEEDEQRELYETLMKDTVVTLMQTELCGMPINPKIVQKTKALLKGIEKECTDFFDNSAIIQAFHEGQRKILMAEKTAAAKKKVYQLDDKVIQDFVFNPGSDTQLRKLLYDYLGYPVIDMTKGKQASCAGDTLKKLKANCLHDSHLPIFEYLGKLADVSILLSTFIPAFENAQQLPDGSWRLYGNFNATGTQSLRLSSSNPNLMNLPSGSTFAKPIKECFEPAVGWLFCGSDFDALEDKTGALLTRDPNRLKIYTDGFCGHCLRAQSYWPDEMPDIDPDSVDSINSIKKKYKKLRQKSKAPSFALQYMGTYITLMNNCGFSKEEALAIEANYHKLYEVSDKWAEDIVEKAKETGYVTMAFGARIRTPLLAKTVGKGRSVPYAAKAEARSAGNAATQSYCVLTLRAFNEFRKRLWASEFKYDILPSATIHDAIYLMVRNGSLAVQWVNDNLIDCMRWQELPELQHDTIKITSNLEIFWPSWANGIELENNISDSVIMSTCKQGRRDYKYLGIVKAQAKAILYSMNGI